MSEMRGTRLAENAGPKKVPKNRHLGTIHNFVAQLCRAISSQLRHVSTIAKNLLSSCISSTCPHNMVNFGPLAAEIVSLVWRTPANFYGFRILASLLQRRRSMEANQTLHNVWPLPGLVDYIFGSCCSVTEFCQVQNSLYVLQVLRSPIGSVTARQLSSGREPNFAALSTGRPSRWALAHILVKFYFLGSQLVSKNGQGHWYS